MKSFLYNYNQSSPKTFALRVLLVFLIIGLISPPVLAQQSRRGLFLQDELPTESPGSPGLGVGEAPDGLGVDSRRRRRAPGTFIYQVHVLGEVNRPGTYRVSPSMRVTDALRLAGEIRGNGSQRFVEFKKSGKKKGKNLDLFAYKTLGEISQNPYLRNNDTIFVPLKKSAVEIEGPIRRPGIYELRNERTLYDLVNLTGGFTVGAIKSESIKIVRYSGNEEKEIIEIPILDSDMRGFFLKDGDVVIVPHKFLTKHEFDYNLRQLPNDNIFYPAFEDKVFVIGGVKAPGAFQFNQYYTLRQYLTLAGGTTIMAKRGKINVVTVNGKTYKAKNAEYDRTVNPGDTIVVPEKSVPTTFYIGLMPTIASLGLSAVALFK